MSATSMTNLQPPARTDARHNLLFSHLVLLASPARQFVETYTRQLASEVQPPPAVFHSPSYEAEPSSEQRLRPGRSPIAAKDEFENPGVATALQLGRHCVGAIRQFPGHDIGGLNHDRFWDHSVATACIAFRLAGSWRNLSPGLAFLGGLLHDVGKAAFDATIPKSYQRVLHRVERTQQGDVEAEQEFIGLDHSAFGAQLLRLWKMPAEVVDAALLHHRPGEIAQCAAPRGAYLGLISLANALAYQAGLGLSPLGRIEQVDGLARVVGLQPIDLAAAVLELPGLVRGVREKLNIPVDRPSEARQQNDAPMRRFGEPASLRARLGPEGRLGMTDGVRGSDSHESLGRWTKVVGRFLDRLRDGDTTLDVCVALTETLETDVLHHDFVVWGIDPSGEMIHAAACGKSGIEARSWPVSPSIIGTPSALDGAAEIQKSWPGFFAGGPPRVFEARRSSVRFGGILVDPRAIDSLPDTVWILLSHVLSAALAEATARVESIVQLHRHLDQRRRVESEQGRLLRVRSLEVLSHLAAGAAHEMNNPLTVISGRAQLLLMNPSLDASARKSIETIRNECQRCTGIISELMAVAKPAPPKPALTSLHTLLENARMRALAEFGLRLDQIELVVEDDRIAVFADPAQLATALDALLRNAVEAATSQSVKVSINSRSRRTDDPCVVVLRDNGRGMTPEALASALDPFFSERQAGRGRGLGLSRAQRLVERNRGRLDIESSPGRGTRIVLSLPTTPWSA